MEERTREPTPAVPQVQLVLREFLGELLSFFMAAQLTSRQLAAE
jgi:hypothetical protein